MYGTITYKILTVIKKYLNGWEPTDIFHDGHTEYHEYDKPDIGFFGTSYGFHYDKFTYTKLGSWFEDVPDIISLLKLFWYIPAWVVYIITNIAWFIFELFLPRKLKETL